MAHNDSTGFQTCLILPEFDENLNVSYLPLTVQPTRMILAVLNGAAAPPTFIVNLFIVWTVMENEELRLNSYNILLAALAVTDVLVGLLTQPTSSWRLGCLAANCHQPCWAYMTNFITGIICIVLTMSTLMMVSLERYLAIRHPFFYCDHVTVTRMVVATAITWIVTPTCVLASRLSSGSTQSVMKKVPGLLIAMVHVVVKLFCFTTVQITAYRQRKDIITQIAAVQANSQENDSNHTQEQRNRLRDIKRAFTMGLVICSTVLFYCNHRNCERQRGY